MKYSNEFNVAFWDWFDTLPIGLKEKFWYYPADLAKVYFYNKLWTKVER